jgi:DNA-binding GntR family transcriptional regulator
MSASLDTQKDLENLQRRSLKEEIFDVLHDKIIAGKVGPGEWLRQEDIASQLGVSMTPVREALDLLVSVGLAERVPYRGVRVPQPDERGDCRILRHAAVAGSGRGTRCGS